MPPFSWSFTTLDATAPVVTNNTPTGVDQPRASSVEFDISDSGSGVDPATVVVTVDGVVAFSGGSTQNSWGGAGLTGPVGDTYHMALTPPGGLHPNYATIGVDVDADDIATNTMTTFSWSFTTADVVGPTVVNEDPLDSGSGAPTTNIQFDVLDTGAGVAAADIVATVEAVEAYNWNGVGGDPNAGFKTGFDGPGSAVTVIANGFRVVIDPTVDFTELDTVDVEVTAQDLATTPNVTVRSWSFDVLDSSAPSVTNEFPTGTLIPKETDISFDIKDAPTGGAGVDLTTVVVEVEGDVAYNWNGVGVPDDGFFPGWDGPNSAVTVIVDGYHFVIDKTVNLPTETLIDVTVDASDSAVPPNVMPQFAWNFLTEVVDTDSPYFTAISPVPSTAIDELSPEIVFRAIDDTTGINLVAMVIEVAGALAYTGGAEQVGFQVSVSSFVTVGIFGPVTQYQFNIVRDTPFVFGDVVEVTAYAEDNGNPNDTTEVWDFAVGIDKPVAVLNYNEVNAIIGSIIQMDGRPSYDPNNRPLTWHWSFTRVPIGSEVNPDQTVPAQSDPYPFTSIWDGDRAVRFIPDKVGVYEVQLIVNNGYVDSDPASGFVSIGLNRAPCGDGIVPDLSFLWNYISDFWKLVDDKEYLASIWSATAQIIGAETVKLWANDYNKSLDTIQEYVPRRWQRFEMYTDLREESQRVLVGYTGDGTGGQTGALAAVETSTIIGVGTVAANEVFSGTLDVPDDSVLIPGTVKLMLGAVQVGEDDGNGQIFGVVPYSVTGQVDYDTRAIQVAEVGDIWGIGSEVLSVYDVASENTNEFHLQLSNFSKQQTVGAGTAGLDTVTATLTLPPESNLVPGSVRVWKNGYTDPPGSIVAVDDRRGNLLGAGLTATVDYETNEVIITELSGVFGAGDSIDVGFDITYTDFEALDLQRTAKGRVLVVNGTAGTVDRVKTTDTETIIFCNDAAFPGGLTNATWRIPHLLHVPSLNLEDFNVRTGDLIIFEVTRADIGATAELQAQVVGVDRDRVGFEFSLDALTVGGETIDRGQFTQLVKDLRIVPADASDAKARAAAESVLSFMPMGVNINSRTFTPYRITMRAKTLIHNTAIRVHSDFATVPSLQEELWEPPVILRENWDYTLGGGDLQFQGGLFTLTSPAPQYLWAECAMVDNTPAIENNFGAPVGIMSEDLTQNPTRLSYLSAVKGLWYAITSGPTVANIRLGLQIFLGLPFAEERGRVISIMDNYSTDPTGLAIGRMLVEDVDESGAPLGLRRFYFYPVLVGLEDNPVTGVTYVEGDVIERFAPVSKGVEVEDYIKNPDWWRTALVGLEVLKFFTFKVAIDGNVFDLNDANFALDFLAKVKPAYTKVLVSIFKRLADDPLSTFDESMGSNITAQLYTSPGFGLPALRLNQNNSQGVTVWGTDLTPFKTRSSTIIFDAETTEDTGSVVAESAGGFSKLTQQQQVNIGGGSTSEYDPFSITLSVPAGGRILPGSVVLRRNGSGVHESGDFVTRDDRVGSFDTEDVNAAINYATGYLTGSENGVNVWDLGTTIDVDFTTIEPNDAVLRGRVAGDLTTPAREGDILVIGKGQSGSGVLDDGLYEVDQVVSATKLQLLQTTSRQLPGSYDPVALDTGTFEYGDGLRCSVLRRMTGDITRGTDGVSAAGDSGVLSSAGSTFLTDGAAVDDHLVLEPGGADEGEFRVYSVNSETELTVVDMDGTLVTWAGDGSLKFRIIKPVLLRRVVPGARSVQSGPQMALEVIDPNVNVPLAVFTPGMVGSTVQVANSEDPSNNGSYTITAYVHPGKVEIDTAARPVETSLQAVITIHSNYHPGLERLPEMFPVEAFEAFLQP